MKYIEFDKEELENYLKTRGSIINEIIQNTMSDSEIYTLIDSNKFNEAYIRFNSHGLKVFTFTALLLISDIDFLPYLSSLPMDCFTDALPITKLIIPKNIKRISGYSCRIPWLSEIEYEGTVEEWNSIHIDNKWCSNTLKTIKCIDGVIKL